MQKANSDTTCKILAGFMRQKLKNMQIQVGSSSLPIVSSMYFLYCLIEFSFFFKFKEKV